MYRCARCGRITHTPDTKAGGLSMLWRTVWGERGRKTRVTCYRGRRMTSIVRRCPTQSCQAPVVRLKGKSGRRAARLAGGAS
jgi:hypothetical protein